MARAPTTLSMGMAEVVVEMLDDVPKLSESLCRDCSSSRCFALTTLTYARAHI